MNGMVWVHRGEKRVRPLQRQYESVKIHERPQAEGTTLCTGEA